MARYKPSVIYIPNPTWGNHKNLIEEVGLKFREYPYWNAKDKSLDIAGMLNSIKSAPAGFVILLHPCAHNLTKEQWLEIAHACADNGHFPLFDSAYQGFATGDFKADAYSIQIFAELIIKFLLCQFFSKNFGCTEKE